MKNLIKAFKYTGTMNKVLVLLAIFLVLFTLGMIAVYIAFQDVPDTLIASVFSICGCECGAMGWIKTVKDKYNGKDDM